MRMNESPDRILVSRSRSMYKRTIKNVGATKITEQEWILSYRTTKVWETGGSRQLFQEANAWWRLPFVWLYKVMMNLFALVIGLLAAVRRTVSRLHSRTGFVLLTLLLLLLPLLLFLDSQNAMSREQLVNIVQDALIDTLKHKSAVLIEDTINSPSREQLVREQLVNIVQDSVRDTLKHESAVLIEDTINSPSREQLVNIVQDVRDALKHESAVLIEDIINSLRLKVLDQVLEKVKNWNPNVGGR